MIKNKQISKGIKFKCQGSGKCCVSRGNYGFVYLSKKDIFNFSKYFNISITSFKNKFCQFTNGYLHLKEINKNGDCIFLNKKKCSVYSSRPIQCRTWPFWNENINPKKWNNEIINFCPGIGKGKKISFDKIKKIVEIDIENENNIIKE